MKIRVILMMSVEGILTQPVTLVCNPSTDGALLHQRPFCGAGIWILSQDWQLYSKTRLLCSIHSQFCQNAPQVQNEFPFQTPISERAGAPPGPPRPATTLQLDLVLRWPGYQMVPS